MQTESRHPSVNTDNFSRALILLILLQAAVIIGLALELHTSRDNERQLSRMLYETSRHIRP